MRKIFKLALFRRSAFAFTPEKEFYFVVNPGQYSIRERDRQGKLKTFGGTWVQNFGPDDKQISLVGNFGLSKVVTGWDGKNTIVGSIKALRYLRDNFIRIAEKTIREGGRYDDYYLKFYDLSEIEQNRDGYLVNVDDFQVARDKSMPYMYQWTLQLNAYGKNLMILPLSDIVQQSFNPLNPTAAALVGAALSGTAMGINMAQFVAGIAGVGQPTNVGIWDSNSGFIKGVEKIKGVVKSWENTFNDALSSANALLDTMTAVAGELGGIATFAMQAMTNVVTNLSATINRYGKLGNEIANVKMTMDEDWNNVVRQWDYTLDLINQTFHLGKYTPSGTVSVAAISEAVIASINGNKTKLSNKLSIGSTQNRDISGTTLVPASDASSPQQMRIGIRAVQTFDSSLSLEEIAQEIQTAPAEIIAAVNPGIDWANRTGGEQIVVPQITSITDTIKSGNMVFDSSPLGTDVAFDSQGFIIVSGNGDVAVVAGTENMKAALARRLDRIAGSLSYSPEYGLENFIGDPQETDIDVVYRSKVADALMKDPRVKDASVKISPSGRGDTVKMDISVTLSNEAALTFSREVPA